MKEVIELPYYCPFYKNQRPTVSCPFALRTIKKLRALDERTRMYLSDKILFTDKGCEWYIIDKESHYCWWVFWSNRKNIKDYSLEEISKLLGLCPASVMNIEKEAYKKVRAKYNYIEEDDYLEQREDSLDSIKNGSYYQWTCVSYIIKYQIRLASMPILEDLIEIAPQVRCHQEQIPFL